MSKKEVGFVSLGGNCEVRIILKSWEDSPGYGAAFDARTNGNNFFDWNITNVWALIGCLRGDFVDTFLLANLVARSETDGKLNYVDDTGSGIRFHHTFSRVDNITTQDVINQEYPEKRSKVEHLVNKFRALLSAPHEICFVRRADDNIGETITLLMALKERRDERPFTLVAARKTELLGDIPAPYDALYRQVLLPEGEWTLEHWQPVLETFTGLYKAS